MKWIALVLALIGTQVGAKEIARANVPGVGAVVLGDVPCKKAPLLLGAMAIDTRGGQMYFGCYSYDAETKSVLIAWDNGETNVMPVGLFRLR